MTPEERAKELVLAQAPGWGNWFPDARVGDTICTEAIISDIASAIREAVKAEREACAMVADAEMQPELDAFTHNRGSPPVIAAKIRNAIRSRSNKPAVTETGKKDDE